MKKLPNRVLIAPLSKAQYPDTMIFVDCETRQKKLPDGRVHHRLWFGSLLVWVLGKEDRAEQIIEHDFDTAGEFWLIVDRYAHPKRALYVFAHNLKFDFMVLDGFVSLPDLGFSLESLYHKFTTLIMKFKRDKTVINLVDSMNYYQVPLSKLAPMVGEQKIETDFSRPNKVQIKARCRSDVKIIYKAVRLIVDKLQAENLGGFKVTAPSVAFSMYRTRFLKEPITTHHNDDLVDLERLSYYGGFVQVFKLFGLGSPHLYKLDINAMYPSVMRANPYPVELVDTFQYPTLLKLSKSLRKHCVTARVIINTDEPRYPYRANDNIYYPLGEFETVLASPSLRYALAHGHIQQVLEMGVYLQRPIFTEFIDYQYGQRLAAKRNNDLAAEMFYKLMMNSLYGKFGQTATNSTYIGAADPRIFETYTAIKMNTGQVFREVIAGGSILHIEEAGESRYTFYAIAAHVTDYARQRLFELIEKAGRENVFYSDTDSLIVNQSGYNNLHDELHPVALGKLKIEDQGPLFIGFAKKDYLLGDKRKLKGFSREPLQGRPHVFRAIQSSTLFGALHRNEFSGSYWRTIEKIHYPFMKGVDVMPSGDVLPLILPEHTDRLEEKIYTLDLIKSLVKRVKWGKRKIDLSKWL